MNLLFIFAGGGFGAAVRYICSQFFNRVGESTYSTGTLFVNTAGALLIGFLFNTFQSIVVPLELSLFLISGFLGGFTTFSTYSLETVRYMQSGNIKEAIINILLNNILCIVFVLAGMALSKCVLDLHAH
ncbi:MAG: fluoride efflux transporter CrcB [Termitinemataceae bacterium]|nr:MAG: fluoride efflux transporter CrcB [Termitinemataceae bacterium]